MSTDGLSIVEAEICVRRVFDVIGIASSASPLVHPSGEVMEWVSVSFIEVKDEYMIVNVYS